VRQSAAVGKMPFGAGDDAGHSPSLDDLGHEAMPDRLHEACGVFGLYAPGEDVARVTYFGLYALQHRGQESAGIASTDGAALYLHRQMGLVSQAFTEQNLLELPGHSAIGHTRYSTTGSSRIENAQPFVMRGTLGEFALAHNGNLTNTEALRSRLLREGAAVAECSDSELIAHLLARAGGATYVEKLRRVMLQLRGAYSLVILTPDSVIGVRDPHGIRPLSLGRLLEHWVIASETCAIETIGGEPVRDINPGEVVIISGSGASGLQAHTGLAPLNSAACLFEYIYFARPDSSISDCSLYLVRQRMGAQLAEEYPVAADLVVGVPDSATPAAAGYAAARGLPYTDGLIKNRYIGRTFIQPDQRLRQLGVKLKFNALSAVLAGKRVVMVDDSVIRGTTIRPLVKMLRDAGAAEVHLGITSPPFRWPCYLGLDVAGRDQLIAARFSDVQDIASELGVDSLHYLSLDGLIAAIDLPCDVFCTGCFTGVYPMPVDVENPSLEVGGGFRP
jgi:amidophosphoribosyltransferase